MFIDIYVQFWSGINMKNLTKFTVFTICAPCIVYDVPDNCLRFSRTKMQLQLEPVYVFTTYFILFCEK